LGKDWALRPKAAVGVETFIPNKQRALLSGDATGTQLDCCSPSGSERHCILTSGRRARPCAARPAPPGACACAVKWPCRGAGGVRSAGARAPQHPSTPGAPTESVPADRAWWASLIPPQALYLYRHGSARTAGTARAAQHRTAPRRTRTALRCQTPDPPRGLSLDWPGRAGELTLGPVSTGLGRHCSSKQQRPMPAQQYTPSPGGADDNSRQNRASRRG
jgi:hypothetical protein